MTPTDDSDPVLLQGTYDPPGVGSWFALGIGLLCAAAAIKFVLIDDAADVAVYPASAAAGAVLWFLIAWLRKGRIQVTPHWISGRRRVGGRFDLALEDVHQVKAKDEETRLLAADGRELLRLISVKPKDTTGLLWFLVRYRERLPAEVLAELGGPARLARHPEVQRSVHRTFWEAEGQQSRKTFGDVGILVSLGDRHVYFPRMEPIGDRGVSDLVGLVLPVRWYRRLKLTDAPDLKALPVEAFIDAVLTADRDERGKAELLGMVATELGGMDLQQAIGEDGSLWGEAAGRTVSIQARAADGMPLDQDGPLAETLIRRLSPRRLLTQLAIAAAMLAPGVGLVVAGSILDDPGRGTPGWVLELCGIAGTTLILFGGIWLFIGPTKMSKAIFCRACSVPVRTGSAGFPLDWEEEIVAALTMDDPAALVGLPARGMGQGRLELRLDYCPACRAMGQIGLDRVVQVREPLMKADTPVTGQAVAILAEVVEEQMRSSRD